MQTVVCKHNGRNWTGVLPGRWWLEWQEEGHGGGKNKGDSTTQKLLLWQSSKTHRIRHTGNSICKEKQVKAINGKENMTEGKEANDEKSKQKEKALKDNMSAKPKEEDRRMKVLS